MDIITISYVILFIGTWLWPLLAALVTLLAIYLLQRPRIRIRIQENEKPNTQFGAKFVHILVTNKSFGLLRGGVAEHCKGTITVDKPGKKVFVTKWATKRDPVSLQYVSKTRVIQTVDLVAVEESKYETIFPGETKPLDVALKLNNEEEFYMHEPENFIPPIQKRKKPDNLVGKGEFICTVSLECGNHRTNVSHTFKLVNRGSGYDDFFLEELTQSVSHSDYTVIYDSWRWSLLAIGLTLVGIPVAAIVIDGGIPYFFGWYAVAEMVLSTILGIVVISASFQKGFQWWFNGISKRVRNEWISKPQSIVSFLIVLGSFGIAVSIANLVVGYVGKEYTKIELLELASVVLASFLFIALGLYSGHKRSLVAAVSKKRWETLIESVLLVSIVISVLSIILFYIQVLTTGIFWVTIIALWLSVYASSDIISREISTRDSRPNS
jgi:putative Mn2+ efflux pump MntP